MLKNFNDKTTTKKGSLGEKIVDEYLKGKGWSIYKTDENSGPHAFDRLAVKDKKHIIIAEVKSKAKMNYMNATGIDLRHFNEYLNIHQKYNLEIFMFFVDESPTISAVYGNKFSVLIQPEYSQKENRKYPCFMLEWKRPTVLFDYDKMLFIKKLTATEREELERLSTRNYKYNEGAE